MIQKFAVGGKPDPRKSLENYFADASTMNLDLANSRGLNKAQRTSLASDVRNLRQLRTPAPATLYSSISRLAFDKMASQVGFNKSPTIPEGTKYNDIEKILDKEAKAIIGKSFSLPGFVSTSKDYSKAKTFLDNAPRSLDSWAAMLTIATKQNAKGVDVEKQLSGRPLNITKRDINPRTGKMETMYMNPPSSEQEVMLQPRSRFRINQARAIKLGTQKNLLATAQQFAAGGRAKGVDGLKKRGFFFDFDDTLAETGAIERPGTADPYSDFRGAQGKKFLETASATKYAAMAKRRALQGNDIWVLTARPGDKDTVGGIRTFGSKHGLNFKGVIGVAGMSGKKGVNTSTAKSMILSRYTKNYPDGIVFVDDLKENILAAQEQMAQSRVPFKSIVAKKNLGGFIQRFASGGIVPGVGNGDTVPATLEEGAFVVRKSSVSKLGAENLASMAGYAAGGNVSKRVPALLTPGEFVFDEPSAKSIGYGNLNRMNKVGKYANGGIVQRFAAGGTATAPPTSLQAFNNMFGTSSSGGGSQQSAQATQQATKATQQFGIGLSLVSSSLQAMLPPIDGNSSAITKMGNSLLGLATTVGGAVFALESFGVALNKTNVTRFLTGGGIKGVGTGVRDGVRSVAKGANALGMPTFGRIISSMAMPLGKFALGLTKLLGPLAAATVAFMAVKSVTDVLIKEIFGDAKKLKETAIARGDVDEARKQAQRETSAVAGGGYEYSATLGSGALAGAAGGATAGALIGSVVPVIGTALGAAIGGALGAALGFAAMAISEVSEIFTGAAEQAGRVAAAQAGAVVSAKALESAEKEASRAMEDFKNGTKSAKDVLMTFAASNEATKNQRSLTSDVVSGSMAGRSEYGSGKILRNMGAYLGGGLFGMETAGTRNQRLDTEGANAVKSQREQESQQFSKTSEARNLVIRSGFARGKTEEQIQSDLKDANIETPEQIAARAGEMKAQASDAKQAGNTKLEAELTIMADMLDQQSKDMKNSMENIGLSVMKAKAAFDAMSLGLRSATAISSAQSASMTKFAAGLEVGGSSLVNDVAFLQEAVSSAAQAMDPEEIKKSIDNVANSLTEFGVDKGDVDKFRGNTSAFIQAQANYNASFDKIKDSIASADFQNMSADDIKKKFAEELSNGLEGVDEETRNNLKAVINNLELDDADIARIIGGDKSVIGDKLSESQKKMFDEVAKIAQERQKAEQVLIDLTKKRIEAERNALEAQKEALSLTMEGRELQGKYGGKVVTNEERRQNVLARANVNSSGSGLSNMKTGSLSDIRGRNKEILDRFTAIEDSRTEQNGMKGVSGVRVDETQKDLQKAQKDQINTIRELIKLEEENLKLIGEKNKLEKDSIDALVAGDIDKFMQTQATVGATAAIATGNKSLMGAFGPEALGLAAQDIRRQQDAGVQSLYGTQLSGQGGLTQQAFGSALGARGITDPRLAQVASGTTAEEEASKSRLRDYGTALGETGQLGAEMANMQLESATINVSNAEVILNDTKQRGLAAIGKAAGGLIYANRGMFIPRGTDTVPAMLTPGEFVVRREAVNRGNNLQLLQQMNGAGGGMANSSAVMGFARGGRVQYYAEGGVSSSSGSAESFEKLTQALSKVMGYVNGVAESIKSLPTTISHQIGDTKIDVNVAGGNMLKAFGDNLESRVMNQVSEKLKSAHSTENGININQGSVLG